MRYSTLIISLMTMAFLIGVMVADVGESRPAFKITNQMVLTLVIFFVVTFLAGFESARKIFKKD
jgi:hypothetical protein